MKNGIYFVTIKESDAPNDNTSKMNRENIFRLSIGIGKKEYQKIFGPIPIRPPKGEIVKLDYNFSILRKLMPHPIYSWLGWVCILNPELEDIFSIKNLIDIAYNNCLMKYKKNMTKNSLLFEAFYILKKTLILILTSIKSPLKVFYQNITFIESLGIFIQFHQKYILFKFEMKKLLFYYYLQI